MKVLAIIPARGGSKGIPRKNVIPVGGKPLIAWNIAAARGAKNVERVVVSTDDPEIGAVAKDYGAEVVWRPAELATDKAASELALLHVLQHLRETEGYQPDIMVFMQATSPLTASEDIDRCVARLLETDADSAFSVTDFHYFLWRPTADGGCEGINHDKRVRPMRQDREAQYLETGAIYVMRAPGFLEHRHRFFGKTVFSVMPAERCMEIDEPADLLLAESMLARCADATRRAVLPPVIEAVVFDFDGVMTDNRVWLLQDGREAVCCHRADGWGVAQLRERVKLAIMSSEENQVVQARAAKLKIPCFNNLGTSKLECMVQWCASQGLARENVVFVGNDENDVACLQWCGCGVVPADATKDARSAARMVLRQPGGAGAVREVCDAILQHLMGRKD